MSDYNGWKNRETWLVKVHDFFDGDYFEENKFRSVDEAAAVMADSFDEWFADEIAELHPFLKDLITTHEIDWRELAKAHQEDWKIAEAEVE